jgi:hypothetical protein
LSASSGGIPGRLCVLILKFRLSIWLRGRLAAQAVGLRQYKGMRKPEFQEIRRIKTALFIRSAFRRSKIFWILVQLVCLAVGCPVSLVFFIPIRTGSTYNGTHKLVERDNSLPEALLPLSHHSVERGVVFGFAAERRLGL